MLEMPLYDNGEGFGQIEGNLRSVSISPPRTCCFAFVGAALTSISTSLIHNETAESELFN